MRLKERLEKGRLAYKESQERAESKEVEKKPGSIGVLRVFAWLSAVAGLLGFLLLLFTIGFDKPAGIAWAFSLLLGGLFICVFYLVIASIAENVFLIRCNTQKELSPSDSGLNS